MKFLRHKFISGVSIWLVIIGLMSINASIGKLSQFFPNTNINSLLLEEINKDIEESSESVPFMDGDGEFLNEFDWHVSFLLYLGDSIGVSQKRLHTVVHLNFGNVHLDRFSPPPEA